MSAPPSWSVTDKRGANLIASRDLVAGRRDDDLERRQLDRHPVGDEQHRNRIAVGLHLNARFVVDDRVGDLGELEGLLGQRLKELALGLESVFYRAIVAQACGRGL